MSRALIPIETIADDICLDLGDSTSRFKFSILRKLMAGFRELHLYVDQSFCVKTAVLTYDNVIALPSDFVYETKVGIMVNGRIAVMTLDKEIRRETLTQMQTEQNVDYILGGGIWGDQFTFYNYPYTSTGLGELYGYGGSVNINGYYNINRKLGEIYIGSLVPVGSNIVVEYKSNGIEDGLTLIPIEMWNCLKYYAKSEWYADKNTNLSMVNRQSYEREYNKIQRLYNYRTALFMGATAQSMYKSSPR
jgi:hypothetical protein